MIAQADEVVARLTGHALGGGREDLRLIDAALHSGRIGPEDTQILEALGMAFGQVFATEVDGYDWWTIEDGFGRDPCLRYRDTHLTLFPRTLLSKRVEDGEPIDVPRLFELLAEEVARILKDGMGG